MYAKLNLQFQTDKLLLNLHIKISIAVGTLILLLKNSNLF
ncbi:hypothetical protein CPter291_2334 [Collimonas pratensis]|uniref:Uncharacterized protein n=1 Tax=Collimonas pratensis TaxID=279113 RepID=A0ABM5Z654_9BURK|nr:hypothetical protein CPter291_2334 [Collimonas pratensis]